MSDSVEIRKEFVGRIARCLIEFKAVRSLLGELQDV